MNAAYVYLMASSWFFLLSWIVLLLVAYALAFQGDVAQEAYVGASDFAGAAPPQTAWRQPPSVVPTQSVAVSQGRPRHTAPAKAAI